MNRAPLFVSLTMSVGVIGIQLAFSWGNTITNNTTDDIYNRAIHLFQSPSNIVSHNQVTGLGDWEWGERGICLDYSTGNVIGVNTAIYGPSGNIGIGFAMPISRAQALLRFVKGGGEPAESLGTEGFFVPSRFARALKLPAVGHL